MSLFVREKGFYKSFFWLTLVIGMQNLISVGVNLSDNVMLGGYSESALSGVALANQQVGGGGLGHGRLSS